ncbi:MAG TPA: M42 family metallopeptidase [Firmicutes bacterium]|jgi:putative aminopeptidase FrvX|nr:M42 family metallopeptidase [Bacillota bacterium]
MLLKELSALNGVSSNETTVRHFIRDRIQGKVETIRTDRLGNLLAGQGQGKKGPKIMLSAHMDEVGLMVVGIDPSGLLKIKTVGSIDERVLLSKRVLVGPQQIPGVIGAKPIHLQEREERQRPMKLSALFVDIGATDRSDAEKVVNIGDLIAFDTKPDLFGDGLFKGKALDDRAGCAVLLNLIEREYNLPLYYAFTVQEEVGLRGATVAAFGLNPDLAIVVETTSAGDVPPLKKHQASTRLGLGPAISVMDRSVIVHPKLVAQLVAVAEAAKIPYQFRQGTSGGTEAGAINQTRAGIPAAVISIPCRYIHSPVGVLNLNDFEQTINLIDAVLKNIEQRGLPV